MNTNCHFNTKRTQTIAKQPSIWQANKNIYSFTYSSDKIWRHLTISMNFLFNLKISSTFIKYLCDAHENMPIFLEEESLVLFLCLKCLYLARTTQSAEEQRAILNNTFIIWQLLSVFEAPGRICQHILSTIFSFIQGLPQFFWIPGHLQNKFF